MKIFVILIFVVEVLQCSDNQNQKKGQNHTFLENVLYLKTSDNVRESSFLKDESLQHHDFRRKDVRKSTPYPNTVYYEQGRYHMLVCPHYREKNNLE